MRILADENFPEAAVEALRHAGHDVRWVRTEAPGISDREVLARAQADTRIVVTFDKDFGELAFRFGLPADCGVILFRVGLSSPLRVAQLPSQHSAHEMTGPETSPWSKTTEYA
jgi:predicted nuclease of predicted toxin-antitoxin system